MLIIAIDDYGRAIKKLKQAEVCSDVQTDIEEQPLGKRKSVRPKRIASDSSSEGDVDEVRHLPLPPKVLGITAFSNGQKAGKCLFILITYSY